MGNNKFLFFGGLPPRAGSPSQPPLWFYDATRGAWIAGTRISGQFSDRHSHAAVYVNGILYVFGGSRGYDVTNELLIISLDGEKYSSCTVRDDLSAPCARCHHTMTVVGNKVYLFGGNTGDGQLRGDLWEMDLSVNPLKPQWTIVRKSGPSMRQQHIAFTRDGALFIAGGVGEDEEILTDIWRFDGSDWQQVAVFDYSLRVFGCSQGLLSVDDHGVVSQLEESPTMAVLVERFATLKGKQHIKMEKIAERWNNIGEMRVEMERLTKLMAQVQDGNMQNASEYFSDAVMRSLCEEVEKLREQYVEKTVKVLDFHASYFCTPGGPPSSAIQAKSEVLAAKRARVRKKYEARINELEKEISVYTTLRDRAPAPSSESNELHSKIIEFIKKQNLLERQTLRLNHQHAKIRKLNAKIERNNTMVLDLIHEIADLEQVVEQRKKDIDELKERMAPLENSVEREKAKFRLLNTPPEHSRPLIDSINERSNQLRETYRRVLKDQMPADVKSALRSLIALSNVLYEQYRKEDTLRTVQKQVSNFTAKLFASLKSDTGPSMVLFESFEPTLLESPRR